MRKSFDGLSGLVIRELEREPTSGEVFIFINKRRSHLKLLHWENGGFVLYYKRLEKGTFTIPDTGDSGYISWPELILMIEGIRIEKASHKPRFIISQTV
jgi:transposase